MNTTYFQNLLCSLDRELSIKFGYLVYQVVQHPADESLFVVHSRNGIFNIPFIDFIISWCMHYNAHFCVCKAPFLGVLELKIYVGCDYEEY